MDKGKLVSDLLKEIRKKYNLSQFQLSEILKTDQRTISYLENIKAPISLGMLKRLAEKFNLNVDHLMD
jgi:transcriptional regulator with XRE-family HTH domain